MYGDNKNRYLVAARIERSFIHTNPGPKSEPPFSALRSPSTNQPSPPQSSQNDDPGTADSSPVINNA